MLLTTREKTRLICALLLTVLLPVLFATRSPWVSFAIGATLGTLISRERYHYRRKVLANELYGKFVRTPSPPDDPVWSPRYEAMKLCGICNQLYSDSIECGCKKGNLR